MQLFEPPSTIPLQSPQNPNVVQVSRNNSGESRWGGSFRFGTWHRRDIPGLCVLNCQLSLNAGPADIVKQPVRSSEHWTIDERTRRIPTARRNPWHSSHLWVVRFMGGALPALPPATSASGPFLGISISTLRLTAPCVWAKHVRSREQSRVRTS